MAETRQLLDRATRRASILHGAAVAFAAEGFAATSMQDVADAAGVTKLILYRHFDGKEALYRAVLEQVSSRMRDELEAHDGALAPGSTAVRALLAVGRESPDGYRLLVFHAPREAAFEPQALGYWEDAATNLDRLLGDRVQAPAIRQWVVRSLLSYLLHEVLLWLQLGDERNDDLFVEQASAGLTALVRAWTVTAQTD